MSTFEDIPDDAGFANLAQPRAASPKAVQTKAVSPRAKSPKVQVVAIKPQRAASPKAVVVSPKRKVSPPKGKIVAVPAAKKATPARKVSGKKKSQKVYTAADIGKVSVIRAARARCKPRGEKGAFLEGAEPSEECVQKEVKAILEQMGIYNAQTAAAIVAGGRLKKKVAPQQRALRQAAVAKLRLSPKKAGVKGRRKFLKMELTEDEIADEMAKLKAEGWEQNRVKREKPVKVERPPVSLKRSARAKVRPRADKNLYLAGGSEPAIKKGGFLPTEFEADLFDAEGTLVYEGGAELDLSDLEGDIERMKTAILEGEETVGPKSSAGKKKASSPQGKAPARVASPRGKRQ